MRGLPCSRQEDGRLTEEMVDSDEDDDLNVSKREDGSVLDRKMEN